MTASNILHTWDYQGSICFVKCKMLSLHTVQLNVLTKSISLWGPRRVSVVRSPNGNIGSQGENN